MYLSQSRLNMTMSVPQRVSPGVISHNSHYSPLICNYCRKNCIVKQGTACLLETYMYILGYKITAQVENLLQFRVRYYLNVFFIVLRVSLSGKLLWSIKINWYQR
jgi:hypothetical protein